DGELAFRALNVIAVEPVIDAQLERRLQSPVVAQKFRTRSCVLDVGCQLKCFTGFFRRGDKTQELARLAPEISPAAPCNVFDPTGRPIRDRSENGRAGRGAIVAPQ